jgi:hypothetical protein
VTETVVPTSPLGKGVSTTMHSPTHLGQPVARGDGVASGDG